MNAAAGTHLWLHRFALLTAVATFPLVFVGGLVTSTGSALAVPDWPTTFGYNMFLYPIAGMVGGILYEHSHRLLGAVVGFLTIILALWLWMLEPKLWLRLLGSIALGAVILQGVLGGLRVVLLAHALAIVHACLAQAFLGLLVSIVIFTAPIGPDHSRTLPVGTLIRLRQLGLATTAVIYLQMVFGAILRHTGTRLDAHLVLAALVVLLVMASHWWLWRHHPETEAVLPAIMLLSVLLLVQLALGLGAYLVKYTPMAALAEPGLRVVLTTTHLALGSLLFVTSLVLTLRTFRFKAVSTPKIAPTLLAEQVSL